MARILIGNIKGPQGIQGNPGNDGGPGPQGPPGPMGAVDNTTPIEFTESAQRANLVSGDSIAELFGKQRKWNEDMKPVAFSGNYADLEDKPIAADIGAVPRKLITCTNENKNESVNKVDNPNLIFGNSTTSYIIDFYDRTSSNNTTAVARGTRISILGYQYGDAKYGSQLMLGMNKDFFKLRTQNNGTWSEWQDIYGKFNKPTPAEIGAASVGELASTWAAHGLGAVGWHRIAKCFFYGRDASCAISIKRNWSTDSGESHKVQLIAVYSQAVFKSVYDKSHTKLILKIRAVKVENDIYIDVFYNLSSNNPCVFVIEDIMTSSANDKWELLDSVQVVPETATGETVLATMEFEANSWLGGSL